jgi:RNA polymerase sigma-70 factor, ECF subfamily
VRDWDDNELAEGRLTRTGSRLIVFERPFSAAPRTASGLRLEVADFSPGSLAMLAAAVLEIRRGQGTWLSDAGTATSGTSIPPPRESGDHDPETSRLRALVDLAKEGDADAFGHLYDHYSPAVYRFVYYRVSGSRQLAEDLTSETFFRALRSLSTYHFQGKDFGAWLMTIARNLVTDHFKSSRARLESPSEDLTEHAGIADGPEDQVISGLTNQLLIEALRTLAPEQQECLVLRFLNGYSIAEAAAALGRSEGAVKQLQLRAIRNLSKQLPEEF